MLFCVQETTAYCIEEISSLMRSLPLQHDRFAIVMSTPLTNVRGRSVDFRRKTSVSFSMRKCYCLRSGYQKYFSHLIGWLVGWSIFRTFFRFLLTCVRVFMLTFVNNFQTSIRIGKKGDNFASTFAFLLMFECIWAHFTRNVNEKSRISCKICDFLLMFRVKCVQIHSNVNKKAKIAEKIVKRQ